MMSGQQHLQETICESGQIYVSLKLHDYRVRLVKRVPPRVLDDLWYVEPMGSSAHGSYTAREKYLLDPEMYRLEPEEAEPAVDVDEVEARRQASDDDDRDGMVCT